MTSELDLVNRGACIPLLKTTDGGGVVETQAFSISNYRLLSPGFVVSDILVVAVVAAANPHLFFFFLFIFENVMSKKSQMEGTGRSLCSGEALFLKEVSRASSCVFFWVWCTDSSWGKSRASSRRQHWAFRTRFLICVRSCSQTQHHDHF